MKSEMSLTPLAALWHRFGTGVSSGVALERMDRFFRRLGFRFIGGNYSMSLKSGQEARVAVA
jgi:hypothetical protein